MLLLPEFDIYVFDRLDITFKYQVLMQELSASGVKQNQQAVQWTACPLNGFAKDGKPRFASVAGLRSAASRRQAYRDVLTAFSGIST